MQGLSSSKRKFILENWYILITFESMELTNLFVE